MAKTKTLTAKLKQTFIAELEVGASVAGACRKIGFSRAYVYANRDPDNEHYDEQFAIAWDEAIEHWREEVLLKAAKHRAIDGVDTPVTYQGEITTTYKEYSDTLMNTLLRMNFPEHFTQRNEISGPNGGPLRINNVTSEQLNKKLDRFLDRLDYAEDQQEKPPPRKRRGGKKTDVKPR